MKTEGLFLPIPNDLIILYDLIESDKQEDNSKIDNLLVGGNSLGASVALTIIDQYSSLLNLLDERLPSNGRDIKSISYNMLIVAAMRMYTDSSIAFLDAERFLTNGELPKRSLAQKVFGFADCFESDVNDFFTDKGVASIDFETHAIVSQAENLVSIGYWAEMLKTQTPNEFVEIFQISCRAKLEEYREQLDGLSAGLYKLSKSSLERGGVRFINLYQTRLNI